MVNYIQVIPIYAVGSRGRQERAAANVGRIIFDGIRDSDRGTEGYAPVVRDDNFESLARAHRRSEIPINNRQLAIGQENRLRSLGIRICWMDEGGGTPGKTSIITIGPCNWGAFGGRATGK